MFHHLYIYIFATCWLFLPHADVLFANFYLCHQMLDYLEILFFSRLFASHKRLRTLDT